jgi:hypothetical protein
MKANTYDLVVVGGGAGGIGAALTAGRLGLKTLWVEKEYTVGGTGVHSLVSVWQPAYDRGELAAEIAALLLQRGQALLVAPVCDTPTGRPLYRHAPDACYEDTLTRWHDQAAGLTAPAVSYDPRGLAEVATELALATGRVTLLTDTVYVSADVEPDEEGYRIQSLQLAGPQGAQEVSADWVVDATADIVVARDARCRFSFCREPQSQYQEPSAPQQPENKHNGWTLMFTCHEGPDRVSLPTETLGSDSDWAHICQTPDGGYNVNLCLQLPGEIGWRLGPEQAREWLLANIARRWPLVREAYGLQGYGITHLAPRLGVREGPRLLARRVLNENDIRRGDYGRHLGDCIAWCDHAMDRHAADGGCIEATAGPYGIPFACLLPRDATNLLVASRGAGFSSLAGSACRLQRTMMALGEGGVRALVEA